MKSLTDNKSAVTDCELQLAFCLTDLLVEIVFGET